MEDAYQPIMPLLMFQKSLRHNSSSSSSSVKAYTSVKECSSRINPKRHIDDVNRNSSTSTNYKNKNNKKDNKNNCANKNGESDWPGGTKRQKIVASVPDKGVDCPLSRNPITPTHLENVEDGELSD